MSISLGQMDDAFVEAGKQLNMSVYDRRICIDDIYEVWYDGKPQLEEPESTKLIKQFIDVCLEKGYELPSTLR